MFMVQWSGEMYQNEEPLGSLPLPEDLGATARCHVEEAEGWEGRWS